MSGPSAVDRLRLQRGAKHLHELGPRPLAELIEEVGATTGTTQVIIAKLEDYGRITCDMLRVTGGDRFSKRLRMVSK